MRRNPWKAFANLLSKEKAGWVQSPLSKRYYIPGQSSERMDANELAENEQLDTSANYVNKRLGEAAGRDIQESKIPSTAVDRLRYDPATKILTIVFKNNPTEYDYPDVPEGEYQALLNAPSKGKYVNEIIGPKYSTNRR